MRRLRTTVKWAATACLFASSALPLRATDSFVYAVVYKGRGFEADRTDIFSVNAAGADQRLLFSDAKTPIRLKQHLYVFHFPVLGAGKLLAHAVERGAAPAESGNGALYELTTDGSGRYRKITSITGDQSVGDIFASPDGKSVAYLNGLKGRQYLFVHDVLSGELAYQVDVTDKFLDCYSSSMGWLTGNTLFFTLDIGDVDATSEESYGRVGTYVIDKDGQHLRRLSDPPQREGFFPPEGVRMLGALPSGEYIFETMQHAKRTRPGPDRVAVTLVRVDPRPSRAQEIPFAAATAMNTGAILAYNLSHSGRYLTVTTSVPSASSTLHEVWLKDLQTGKENKLVSLPTKGMEGPFVGLIGWINN